ncbi:Co2+/Mg2+ efflux protein ApaG [Flavobacteriaceae bacterium]|nr:Co2+/Mg2+ efflux protein ApaG [Flavobacteriaceae bacterium]
MIEQITKGIKISIETEFEGTFYKDDCIHYAFSYEVVIENQSPEVAQLIARKWNIMEALNENEIVIGEGVVGEKPVLIPGERHTYTSGCVLKSPFGAMKGCYLMVNLSNSKQFKVTIPTFKLSASFAQN